MNITLKKLKALALGLLFITLLSVLLYGTPVAQPIWRFWVSHNLKKTIVAPDHVANRPDNLLIRLLNKDKRLPDLIAGPADKSKVSIVINKSEYKLTVYYDNKRIKSYPVVFGADPINDKRREGDYRTPEGKFHVQAIYPARLWSKFILIDYPTKASWKKYSTSVAAGQIGRSDKIGGEIGIHGVPLGNDLMVEDGVNWTAGCISLKTADINEVYGVTQVGTPVVIKH